MKSPSLKSSQAFCGDQGAKKEYWGEPSRSHRLWHVKQMWRCDEVLQFRLNLRCSSSATTDSGYPELRSTTSSPRFLFARPAKSKEQFLTNLVAQNVTISVTEVKKISPRELLVGTVAVW